MKRTLIATSLALWFALAALSPVHAGEGHDHGGAPAAPSANGPQRQPDGSVFLPKPAQRQLGVRTFATEAAELPRTVELGAKVLMDPNAGGKVQPLNAGSTRPAFSGCTLPPAFGSFSPLAPRSPVRGRSAASVARVRIPRRRGAGRGRPTLN